MKPYTIVKPIIDFLLALIGILLLWPFFLIIAAFIKLGSKGPVLFKQKRIGKHKKEFYILKFRTMRTDTPAEMPTHLLQDPDFFITKAGKFLRRTSLDELPQIINILKGDMSIIGPRPALWNQYDLIAERDKYRANDIRPGLTGWAQVNGRDELPIEIKARFDGEYTAKFTFMLDLKVFFMTVSSVLKSEGVREGANDEEVVSNTKGAAL
ncbi:MULTISPECIES: sugar transferase [unclassified Paenibacillus]|uniref:sugar transferase n=1 Tax=unclassified Paenibacillus TaxID=185978 RepID=UPI0024068185|nr:MULTISPECIES: sugar transferase [unclassified Paenibacillus]MDF9844053.1 O-antigen biosynthesis protein WbqP [Paenibacillus sp. PastF-2]MDF9850658.1 O-antigen biosynthesis protein WbqP [Paenibacillus sp. PastM-2]MDF9857191.1 O-antigen biosynthesis protein WbqP [Paenibacillus sp. PastF-1]MDH6482508.1 O-antigen biosynthesis protein WbqP [Paenibacillus sp. PastH-2]MDH6509889.1 O-antigen biosynthesis protein WbqP [Paenibacillus sp. PastM-3]